MIFMLHGGRALEESGTFPGRHLLPLLSACSPVHDELCLRVMNLVRSCFAHHNTLVSSIAR